MNKQIKLGILISIVLVIAFSAAAFYQAKNYEASFVKEANYDLSPREIQKYEAQVAQAEGELEVADSDDAKFDAHVQMGQAFHKLGKLSDAKKVFSDAIAIYNNRASAFSALTDVQVEMQDLDGAVESMKSLLKFNSSSSYWRKYLDIQENQLHAGDDVLNGIYVEAVVATDYHISIVEPYARFLEETGNLQAAKEYWQKAGELVPERKAEFDAEIARLDALHSE